MADADDSPTAGGAIRRSADERSVDDSVSTDLPSVVAWAEVVSRSVSAVSRSVSAVSPLVSAARRWAYSAVAQTVWRRRCWSGRAASAVPAPLTLLQN